MMYFKTSVFMVNCRKYTTLYEEHTTIHMLCIMFVK